MKRRKTVSKRTAKTPESVAQLTSFSAARIASRVAALGKEISKTYRGKRLDVVVTLDRGFVFAADLIRQLDLDVVCHFVREDVKDVEQGGHARREVFFGSRPELKGRDVLLVDSILESGVTQDRVGSPSMWTVQAPHCAKPHPKRGPFSFRMSRSAYSSGMSGSSTST